MFSALDLDGDGVLGFNDLKRMRSMEYLQGKTWANLAIGALNWYQKLGDFDGDGHTSKTEFELVSFRKVPAPSEGQILRLFDVSVCDGEGLLKLEDLASDTSAAHSFPLQ